MTDQIREELTGDEIEKMARHAGHLRREIVLKSEARKLAAAKAKEEIDELQSELDQILNDCHHGFRLIPAQQKLFDADLEDAELEQPEDEPPSAA